MTDDAGAGDAERVGMVRLTHGEIQELQAVVSAVETPDHLRRRLKVILTAAEPALTYGDIAERHGQSAKTVSVIIRRFQEHGVPGLYRVGGAGADVQLDARIINTLRTMPEGKHRWSVRLLAEALDQPKSTVARHCAILGIDLSRKSKFNRMTGTEYDAILGFFVDPPVYAMALRPRAADASASPTWPIARAVAALDVAIVAETLDRPRHRTHETLKRFINDVRCEVTSYGHTAAVFVAGYRPSHGKDVIRDARDHDQACDRRDACLLRFWDAEPLPDRRLSRSSHGRPVPGALRKAGDR